MPSLATVATICAVLVAGFSKTVASDNPPLTYFRTLPVETATAWKACVEETKESRGYRIESSHNPYVLWLFFDFGDATHPISELAGYADVPDAAEKRYGRAIIKLTVQTIGRGQTRISASGFFQSLSLPTAAAYLPLLSKGVLERTVVDSIAQKVVQR
ncbi:MAG: hypothetical protein JOZ08_11395 [Verrucomicrobia bacterium]|nr:hypothetical protein [Verrucomicrobiota bacterium]MBV8274567.1 hypothetical protein [Verrucomicrobiota bacterium]